jgi:CubicO group peptidase (beta-lactamase class C family)
MAVSPVQGSSRGIDLRFAVWCAAVLLLAIFVSPGSSGEAAPSREPVPSATAAQVDAIFSDIDVSQSPGYAVGVVKNGQLVFAKGYGLANLEDRVPITPDTVFHLASLSKQFTAAAVALLILDHKLSLDDPVSRYIPETAKYGPALRVKHLVYMTSGLHEYLDVPRSGGLPWYSAYYFTRNDAIDAALEQPSLEYAPGSKWTYSNINYMLLTRIVEKISGRSFSNFMHDRVFQPLDMNASLIDDDSTLVIPHRAIGYAPRSPQVLDQLRQVRVSARQGTAYVRLDRNSPHFGGSGVFTSIDDLAKWDANWYAPRIGGPQFTALMNTRIKFQHDKDNDAFGLVFGNYNGRTTIWYSGGDTDASTFMIRFPDRRLTVIVLSNNPLGDAEGRAMKILGVLKSDGALN